jgi:uncharacterized protein (TIGR02147 family)
VKLPIFEYKDYKKFVNTWLETSPQKGHGLRKKMAQAIGCQTAYVSHVFSGTYHLSSEQGLKCAHWLGLVAEEIDYFLLLINYQRAGTKDLEVYYGQLITKLRSQQTDLKKKSAIKDSLSADEQNTYYSHWSYAAVHMALTIPQLQTMEGLQDYFGLPLNKLTKILNFLVKAQIISYDKKVFTVKKAYIHLEKSSPLMIQHHSNWRLRAIDAIAQGDPNGVHYSGVLSLSADDAEVVREKLANFLKEIIQLTQGSKEEVVAGLCFDCFSF